MKAKNVGLVLLVLLGACFVQAIGVNTRAIAAEAINPASITLSPSGASVGTPVTISVSTSGANASGLHFKYFVNENSYCNTDPANWVVIKDWSTDTSATWTPTSNGRKTIVVWVAEDTSTTTPAMIGGSYEVGASDFIDATTFSLGSATGEVNVPVTVTASGTRANLRYKFFVNMNSWYDFTANWQVIQDWSTSNTCTWTFTGTGLYTIVVWTTGDVNNSSCSGMIGGSYQVGGTIQFPANGYPNGRLLVSGAYLQTILRTPNLVVIDARGSGYETSHIPGAISLQWGPFKGKSVAEQEALLSAAGLNRNMTYVIYDDTTNSWGAAGRIFWMLESLGCNDVHILNGGWDLWVSEMRARETTANTLPASTFVSSPRTNLNSTKDYIKSRLGSADFAVIDSRTDEEYNGWTLYGETRGGHITGAVQIPYESFYASNKTVLTYENLKSLFESNGITKDKEVTSYCTVGIRNGFVYFLLRLMGYTRCSNYDGSIMEWSADQSAPMEKITNYQALVYPKWIDDLIKGNNPPTYPGQGYVILYSSWTPNYNPPPYEYDLGHIPGAIFMNTYAIENGPSSEPMYENPRDANVKPIPELQTYLASLGISKDKTVVVYGYDMMTAGRVAWALLLAGVTDVRVLDGGFTRWTSFGGSVETTSNTPTPTAFGQSNGRPELLAVMDDVKNVCSTSPENTVVVDDRSWDEFIGASNSYYPYFSKVGRIPCAHWIGDYTELLVNDGKFKSSGTIERNWRAKGLTPDQKMLYYCGTGWRSGLYTFYAYLLGWSAANYDGGWYEWSYYPDNPIATGIPQ